MRVAVLGAGPSGLAFLRACESARAAGVADVPEVVCFEKQSDLGGMWNYTWNTGIAASGEPVHGSMYRYLWSNGPKECLEFADYSFEEHFGRPIPSYPPRAVLRDYVMGRVDASDARKHIRFDTAVKWVEFDPVAQTFQVRVRDLVNDTFVTEEFDHVISSTGHFSTPNVPEFEGFADFPGRVLHAHDFREAREFTGRTVLLVGASYSAEDIASQCHKYGAAKVILSYRSRPTGYDWPEGFSEVPLLERLDGSTAHFADGSTEEVDAVILCTGYKHHFDYLPDDLRLKTHNRLYPGDLYKGVVWQQNPRFFYLGMQDQYFTFNMFDAQAWFVRDVIMGKVALPEFDEREADVQAWKGREEALATAEDEIDFQAAYIRDLMTFSDYPEFGVEDQAELLKVWKLDKKRNIMGYRNIGYRSTVTGTVAPPLHDDWLNVLDDSAEAFLRDNGVRPVA